MFPMSGYRPLDNRNNNNARDSIRKVPILKPEQIQKLDHLKQYMKDSQKVQGRGRESIRPSRGEVRPSKSLKKMNHGHAGHHRENEQKQYLYEKEESSGMTKQITLRSDHINQGSKRRHVRAIPEDEEQSAFEKCCNLFSRGEQTINSPFKAARNQQYRN